MPTKQTNINVTLTPSGRIPFAETVLGRTETPIQDSFSSGSLLASILAASVAPMGVFVTRDGAIAYDRSDAANDAAAFTAVLGSLRASGDKLVNLYVFVAEKCNRKDKAGFRGLWVCSCRYHLVDDQEGGDIFKMLI